MIVHNYVPIVSGCLSWDSLANLSLWLLLNLINLTPRCSSISDEKLSLCLDRFLWFLCFCSSPFLVSLSTFSWPFFFFGYSFRCSMSSLPFSSMLEFFSLAAEDSILNELMNVESTLCATCLIRKLCHYACALIAKYWMYIVEIEEICIRYGRTYGRYRKISIGITCVGLASARPNYSPRFMAILT